MTMTYAAAPAPALMTYSSPIEVAAPNAITYDFPQPISAPLHAPVVAAPAPVMSYAVAEPIQIAAAPIAPAPITYDFPQPISAPLHAPVVAAPAPVMSYAVAEPVHVAAAPAPITYDFPAPISAPLPAPIVSAPAPVMSYAVAEPVHVAAPAPITYALPEPVQVAPHVSPVLQYAAVQPAPVMQYAIQQVVHQPAPVATVHQAPPQIVDTQVHYEHRPVVTGYTSDILKPALGGAIGLGEPIVSKEKILAPVRTHSAYTEQVTVQHPTKVNVEKVLYDVEVPTPVAHPVPVPITQEINVHHEVMYQLKLSKLTQTPPNINLHNLKIIPDFIKA